MSVTDIKSCDKSQILQHWICVKPLQNSTKSRPKKRIVAWPSIAYLANDFGVAVAGKIVAFLKKATRLWLHFFFFKCPPLSIG